MKQVKAWITATGISLLAACSGGGGMDDDGRTRAFTARGEADRIAAMYRGQRDMASLVFPYAHDAAALIARHGTTVNCLLGGTVSYAYNSGPGGGIEQRFDATFTNCAETLGLISGTLSLIWNASHDKPASGTFTPSWFATISMDGVLYNIIRPSVINTQYNTVSGVQQTFFQVFSLSGVQPPVGPSATFAQLWLTIQTQPGVSTIAFSDINERLNASTGGSGAAAAGRLRAPGTCTISKVAASAAILGVGNPLTCSWDYGRSNQSNMLETITGPASTSAGLLNVVMTGARTHLSDSGQWDWPTLLSTNNWNTDGP